MRAMRSCAASSCPASPRRSELGFGLSLLPVIRGRRPGAACPDLILARGRRAKRDPVTHAVVSKRMSKCESAPQVAGSSPAMTQCVLRGEAQHPSLRRSLLHPSGPPFRRPGRAQRGPGPIGLSAISLPSREAIRPRRSRPGRRSVCCDAALKIKPLAGLVFVMPAHRRGHPFRWRSRKWLAGPGPRGSAASLISPP